ncbi:helix-turn-helix domain-containing protein [Virgibacillus necropolis]|uniref:AraC family transcriptional regulator n=1 Tax=Virgibacillus necropolis TaxID=163877 RepID=A0A221M968_9BACI|nr:helix-turn-helix domain-containing protein [Virgibacillus necropolis]ASN04171.1 AraC family transcriptional regulator [Virgibacillus necropolis]
MIKLNRVKSRLLMKYIISYLLIFLVPFMIMSTIIYYYSVSSLREEIEKSTINKLQQVESITNERMKELETLAARISYDPRLTPYMISQNYYGGLAIEELNKYAANSSIIEDVFVYYYGDDRIYSTSGSFSIKTLLDKYGFNQWGVENFVQDLHTKNPLIKPISVSNEKHSEMISYIFPIKPKNPNPYGAVMYLIEESEITGLIQNIFGKFKGNSYILSEDNKVIASTINDQSTNIKNFNSLPINNNGIDNVEINGRDYSLASVKSELSGWTFITLMNTDQFFEELADAKLLIMLILFVLLLIGFILAILLGRKQYKPIQNLFEITNKNDKSNSGVNGINELETIHKAITNVFKNHQTLNETVYKQKPFARDQLLVRLLKGDLKDNDEIDSLLHSLTIKMEDGHYFVAIVYFEKGTFIEDNMDEREEVFELLSTISVDDVTLYGVDLLYNDAIALVVSMDPVTNNADKQRLMLISQIQHYIQAAASIDPTIGVGRLYNEKNMINRSYIEALAATEYKFIYPKGSIIYFEAISSQPAQELGYPKDEQIKLVQSLKQGDQIVATETLSNIFVTLKTKDLTIQVLKCICFDIINSIVKAASELGLTQQIHNFNGIVDFSSVEHLHKQLDTVVISICEKVDAKKESHNDKLRNDILDYIKLNYKLYDLSLEKIAMEFQLSISYLSRFIKEQTGGTFTQYVQDFRMEEVKKQLKETDLPVKKIVTQVGYKDVANFTRKFKGIVGVTPGQYRKLNK